MAPTFGLESRGQAPTQDANPERKWTWEFPGLVPTKVCLDFSQVWSGRVPTQDSNPERTRIQDSCFANFTRKSDAGHFLTETYRQNRTFAYVTQVAV